MATPMHQLRKGPRRARVMVPAETVTYSPGYFTEPVRAWAQLQFEPQLVVDPKTRRFATEFAMQQTLRKNGGFDGHPLNLPGAAEIASNLLGRMVKGQVA